MNDTPTVDLLIAGQGAAAYAAALYAARYRLETLVVGERFGGETAIGGTIENYPGYPQIDGFELMLKYKEQVDGYDVRSATPPSTTSSSTVTASARRSPTARPSRRPP